MKKLEYMILLFFCLVSILAVVYVFGETIISSGGAKQSEGMVIVGEPVVGKQSDGGIGFVFGDPTPTPAEDRFRRYGPYLKYW